MERKSYHDETRIIGKIKNQIKLGFDMKYRWYRTKWWLAGKYKIDFPFPIHLDIESTSICNLKCIMCPQSLDPNSFSRGFMDMKLFKKIIDEGAKKGLCAIKLNWRGEPLLHSKIPEMVAYAKKKGIIEVMFNTNGQLLTKEKSKALIEAGLDKIIFSFDGATKKTYEKIRQQGNYDRLVKNIKEFVKIRNEKGLKKPFIRIQTVKMKDTVKEVDKFKEMWGDIVDYVAVLDYSNRGEEKSRSVETYEQVGRVACPQPFQRMLISWEGKVMMCCADWKMRSPIGDATKKSIQEIWHGEPLRTYKKFHKAKQLHKMQACKNCFLKISYDWKKVKTKNEKN